VTRHALSTASALWRAKVSRNAMPQLPRRSLTGRMAVTRYLHSSGRLLVQRGNARELQDEAQTVGARDRELQHNDPHVEKADETGNGEFSRHPPSHRSIPTGARCPGRTPGIGTDHIRPSGGTGSIPLLWPGHGCATDADNKNHGALQSKQSSPEGSQRSSRSEHLQFVATSV
jgi:hypothetical protein